MTGRQSIRPEKQYVVALYDFEAQADGDLDFKAGDRIEVVERTQSTEDWWTGRINGRQGVFPGVYPCQSVCRVRPADVPRRQLCPGLVEHTSLSITKLRMDICILGYIWNWYPAS